MRGISPAGFEIAQAHINKAVEVGFFFFRELGNGLEPVHSLGIQLKACFAGQIIQRHFQGIGELGGHLNRRLHLTVYYSCGLRRNEGVHLDLSDINLDTRILHVRKGKNYKERFVPFGKSSAQLLQEYIYDYRPRFVRDKREGRLFVSFGGRVMNGTSLCSRLQKLQGQSEDAALMQKHLTLHVLRHSIATHLLAAGMSLEKIARFLGHSTMDSTQIYTHLLEEEP